MALSLNTNLPSLTAQRNLARNNDGIARSLQRLSSGMRINSARDDAAAQGFAVVAAPDDENPVAPLRYGLHLRRTDPVWWQAIDEITDAFVDALEGMDAQYDGWESPVVRPDGG